MPWLKAQGEKKGWGKSVTRKTLKRHLVARTQHCSRPSSAFSRCPEWVYFWLLTQTC